MYDIHKSDLQYTNLIYNLRINFLIIIEKIDISNIFIQSAVYLKCVRITKVSDPLSICIEKRRAKEMPCTVDKSS